MGKIGFGRMGEEKKAKAKDIPIRNVGRAFMSMLRDISLAEDEALNELDLEKKIRKELVKLHKQIKLIEKKRKNYDKLMRVSEILYYDYPERALNALKNAAALEQEILSFAHELSQEISKHLLPEVEELYQKLDLSNENKKHIRLIARGLNGKLGAIAGPISNSVQSSVIEKQIKNLIMGNPGLK